MKDTSFFDNEIFEKLKISPKKRFQKVKGLFCLLYMIKNPQENVRAVKQCLQIRVEMLLGKIFPESNSTFFSF